MSETAVKVNQTVLENLQRIVLSYFFWLSLFFLTGWLSKLLIPSVRKMKEKEQMFWSLACVRAICGMLTPVAAYLAFFDGHLVHHHVSGTTDQSWSFFVLITGFFTFEELTLCYFDFRFKTFSKELHIHHFFAFNGFFLSIYFNCAHYYGARAFILEASTPFSCICWCLLKLKLEKTLIWKANQCLLIHIFHLRSFFEMWWWYDIFMDWEDIRENMPMIYLLNMVAGLALVSLWLTPYWTYRKTIQLFNPTDWNASAEEEQKSKKK